jgi:N-acetylglucosamine-6-phosphate deacetylase
MLTGNILTPDGWIHGSLDSENGRITMVDGTPADPANNDAPYILPGFIDLHVHGGGGADVMEGGDAIETIARTHAQFGTTSLLATTMTAPRDELMEVVANLGTAARARTPGGARVLGVHLEGPYINPGKLGAQPDAAVSAVLDEVLKYLSIAPIRVVTLAPEIAGHIEIIGEMAARGARAARPLARDVRRRGHRAQARRLRLHASVQRDVAAASPQPRPVGAALAHAEYAEIIPDLLHVHPGAIRAALRAIPRLYVVTDSTSATGMPDGEYRLGSQHVTKCLGGVRSPTARSRAAR